MRKQWHAMIIYNDNIYSRASFADDNSYYLKTIGDLQIIINGIKKLSAISGLELNEKKCYIFFNKHLDRTVSWQHNSLQHMKLLCSFFKTAKYTWSSINDNNCQKHSRHKLRTKLKKIIEPFIYVNKNVLMLLHSATTHLR